MLLIPACEIMNEIEECTGSTVYVSAARAAEPIAANRTTIPKCRLIANMVARSLLLMDENSPREHLTPTQRETLAHARDGSGEVKIRRGRRATGTACAAGGG